MSELHYGKNVEWFLRELSAHEAGDIESAEIEIIGENDQGVEGFTTIDITLLAADAVSVISALQQKLDAVLADEGYKQAFYEMAYILGFGARPDSPKNVFESFIKPRLEALMKDRGKLASENLTLANLITRWPQEQCPVTGVVTDVQPDDLFPATDAYLNSVRAEGAIAVRAALVIADDGADVYAVSTEVAAQLRAGSKEVGV